MPHVEPLREGDPTEVGVYRIVGRLGAGGQGVVYLGTAPDGRPVAVKVLRGGVAGDDRFAKEVAAARRVEPFCIAQVLDASLSGRPYIVTEYVEGPTLQQAGRHGGAHLQRLAVATATALAAIHQAGVVHRDFKPANVLLGAGGPRVIDFGIARATDSAATVTSSIVGTPAYMAPEQLAGEAVGAPADVFAWASVMVWAATGTPPFGEDTLPAIINRILHNEPQLGDLPYSLRAVVYDCLAKDPRSRPSMQDVLLRLLGGQAAGAPPAGPLQAAGPHGGVPQVGGVAQAGAPHAGMPYAGVPQVDTAPGRRATRHGAAGRSSRGIVAVVAGALVVVVATVTAVVVWRLPSTGESGTLPLAVDSAGSPGPAASGTPTRGAKPTRTPTRRATPKPKKTPTTTPSSQPTATTPTPTRSVTKKPVVSAKVSVLAIDISGGPGQSEAAGCLMPPVHFQTYVEASKQEIWITSEWRIDGKVDSRNRTWVSEGGYTAFVTSRGSMLDAGSHTITLRVTAPGTASRSRTISVCSLENQ